MGRVTAGRQATGHGFLRVQSIFMRRAAHFWLVVLAFAVVPPPPAHAQSINNALTPDWCRQIPRPEYKLLARVHRSEPWFEIYRVSPGVFAIYEPRQFEEVISYLILGEKRAMLFDTGMGIGDIKHVVESITPLPVVLMNSHTHNDHVGGNWQFSEIYGMDTEFTRTHAKGSRDDAQAEVTRDALCGQWPTGFDPGTYATRPWHVTRWMHDGDTVDLGGRVLEVIATPGHTPDAICLLDRKNGLLFTGDTYYPAPIWLYTPETDLDAYARSVDRIAALAPNLHVLLTAHNIPVAEPSQMPRLAEAFKKVR
ncbi:MAG TPA: MBL fold metallo-hydrolase, partial [Candidatus Nitrosotalea sp.]|nr:MBL fold metallo-hydrolase [Candidatus Nitrosotalea sp.]